MSYQVEHSIYVIAVIAIGVFAGCASNSVEEPSGDSQVDTRVELDDDNRLVYRGPITADANAAANEIYESAGDKPEVLLISSPGGKVTAGLDLAEWILDRSLAVEVGKTCFSSCANYIFLAGQPKKLNPESLLGWHGSAWQPSFDQYADSTDSDYVPHFAELREREVCFFERIRVDNLITVHGLRRWPGLRDLMNVLFRGGPTLGFDYKLSDLERLGVSDIEVVNGEWDWRAHREDLAPRVRRTSLDEDYQFTENRFGRCDPTFK